MKQELINIITRLKNDPSRLISVLDAQTLVPFVSSWSATRLTEKYGSVEQFFESLVKNGTQKIILEERKKHGNTTISLSEKKTFTLIPKEVSIPNASQENHFAMLEPTQPPMYSPMLQAPQIPINPMGGFGLGFPELVNLHISANEKARLETENKFLKDENERLKNEVAELKEERLQNKFSEAKAKGNSDILMGLIKSAPALLGIFKGGAVPPMEELGLSGAEPMSHFPNGKETIFEKIAQTSVAVDAYLLATLHGINSYEAFYNDLVEILNKYNLLEQ